MKNTSSPRVLAIIPARGGSKSLPHKNVIDFCGHPLIYFSIREAHRAVKIDATLVSTDSEEIASVAKSLGADVPFLRPAELATDTSRDIEFLAHALNWVSSERGWNPEIVLFLPPTTPSRTADDIDAAITLLDETGADSVRTMVHPRHFNPYKMWAQEAEGGRVKPLFESGTKNMPRQEFGQWYMPVAAAYATRAACIREGRVWGDDVRILPFPMERFTDIDEPEDLLHAEMIMRKNNLL